jgi:HEAT repeats
LTVQKRVRIVLAVLFLGGLEIAAWRNLSEGEPRYHGKPVSSWLENDDGSLGAEQNAQRAVERAGTNAIPTLLNMLRQSDSPLKRKLMDLAQRQRFIKVHFIPAEMRNSGAWLGFSILGSNAAGAVPALTDICNLKISWWSQLYAVKSLGAIGPASKAAIPLLLEETTNAHFLVRAESLEALVRVQAKPELVVAALTNALSDSNGTVRFVACGCLAQLGELAHQAVPALVNSLNDPVRDVRFHAARALKSIDPEAAARVGTR